MNRTKRAIITKIPWAAAILCIAAGLMLIAQSALHSEKTYFEMNDNGQIVSNNSDIAYEKRGGGYVLLAGDSNVPVGNLSERDKNEINEEVEKAKETAYLDLANADEEMKDRILKAREIIIFSSSWVKDGEEAYVSHNGKLEKLPEFSELFPGWDYPAAPEKKTLAEIYEMLDNQKMADSQGFVTGYAIEWDDRYVFLKVARPNRMFVEGDIVKIDYGNANSFVDFSDFRFNMDNKLYVYYNNSDVNLSEMLIVPINIEDPKLTWNYK
ncbi:MAG: hypothetical protein IJS72_02115 [Oscillospiraceae bacterium]|nr:hypothetical protein [Oscillospiraceae bacterium]